jgi:hypothetical protein
MGAPKLMSVYKIDNTARVRDGCIGSGTSGHTRALATHLEGSNCRKDMTATYGRRGEPQNFGAYRGRKPCSYQGLRQQGWSVYGA